MAGGFIEPSRAHADTGTVTTAAAGDQRLEIPVAGWNEEHAKRAYGLLHADGKDFSEVVASMLRTYPQDVPGWDAWVKQVLDYDIDAKVDLTPTGFVLVIPASEVHTDMSGWVIAALSVAAGYATQIVTSTACLAAMPAAVYICKSIAGSLGAMAGRVMAGYLRGDDMRSGRFWAEVGAAAFVGAVGAPLAKYIEDWAKNEAQQLLIAIGKAIWEMAKRAGTWIGDYILTPIADFVGMLRAIGREFGDALSNAIQRAGGGTGRVRIKFHDSRSVCLTAHERKIDPIVLERCDGDNLKGNWAQIDYNNNFYQLKNFHSGECLDAANAVRGSSAGAVYTSKCDSRDGGQLWSQVPCGEAGKIWAAGPTYGLTGWNDNTVSMEGDPHPSKQRWLIMPKSIYC